MRVEPQVLSPIKKHEKRYKKPLKILDFQGLKWRRKRDSILARTARSVFLGRGRPPEVRSVPIPLRIPLCKKRNLSQTARVQLRLLMAQEEGFEPPCRLGKRFSIQRALSSRIVEMCSRHSLASFLVALLTSFVKNSYQLFFAPHPL